MKATGDIQCIPVGSGVSVRKEVKLAHAILEQAGLNATLHPNGTAVEGDLEEILDAVRRIHETLHAEGVIRLVSYVKIATRTDKDPSLEGKLFDTNG